MSAASWVLTGPELEGMELLASGLLAPHVGYRLPGAALGERSPRLRVPEGLVSAGEDLLLCDPDNTPLACVPVSAVAPDGEGGSWIEGDVALIREPEHGVARERRLSTSISLANQSVALVGGELRASDMLAAFDSAHDGPLAVVVEGCADAARSMSIVQDAIECARRRTGTQVWFIPHATTGGSDGKAAETVLRGRGATEVVDLRRAPAPVAGAVLLLTGLSGAGKSTIARALTESIAADGAHRPVLLDGDDMRREMAGELGFGREDRDRNLRRIAWVAARVAEAGGLAVCAPIAPFAASRRSMRELVEPTASFLVVHVSTPLAVAEERDRKGLYARARAGQIPDFTGIDSPYEVPDDAVLEIDTSEVSVADAVALIRQMLERLGVT